jgi:hypothetical protein
MLILLMPHGFDTYRVFISAPGDLEPDRQASNDAIAEVNETTAMPAKVLLVSIGLRDNDQIAGHRSLISDNVRWSTYFIQIFQDDWGPRDLFRKLFLLAAECRENATMPMRDVVVCLKDAPHETNAEILEFRRELDQRRDLRIFHYANADELKAQLVEVSDAWARSLIESRIETDTGSTPDSTAAHGK